MIGQFMPNLLEYICEHSFVLRFSGREAIYHLYRISNTDEDVPAIPDCALPSVAMSLFFDLEIRRMDQLDREAFVGNFVRFLQDPQSLDFRVSTSYKGVSACRLRLRYLEQFVYYTEDTDEDNCLRYTFLLLKD